jgi:spore coat polysaccharide biosynthesis protein SpsF
MMLNQGPSLEKVVAIIQARMSASRLPGKVLLDIEGEPMLVRVVERTRRSQVVDDVVVATSLDKSDDPIEQVCGQRGYACHRGSLHDVLDRYYHAARYYSAEVIVRITADCPVIDPLVIDQTLYAFYGNGASLISEKDLGTRQLARAFSALETAWQEATELHQREHVMPFIYENKDRFRILLINHEPDYGHLRWTVDTPQDLELLRQIYNRFDGRDDFSWLDIIDLFRQEPDLTEINAEVKHNDYRDFDRKD